MKKSSFRRRSALFSSRTRLVLVALLVGMGVVVSLRFLVPSAFFGATAPVFAVGTSLSSGVAGFFASFGDASAQGARISELEREVRALANENLALAAALRDIGVREEEEVGVVAGVVARPPLAPYDMLIVGKGSAQGVSAGNLVTGEGGVPLGTVSTVTGNTAQVLLYSASGRATEGWAGEERTPVTLMGKGSGAFSAQVPREAPFLVSDVIFLPGPGALPVGKIREVETDPSSPSATLHVEPLVNLFSLTYVFIHAPQ